MKRIIINATVFLFIPFLVFSQNQDFQINGTRLVSYLGKATHVIIPEGVTEIYRNTFHRNNSVSITIPASVISIDVGTFDERVYLTEIIVDLQNQVYASVDGVLFNKERTILVAYPGGRRGTYTIPEGVTAII